MTSSPNPSQYNIRASWARALPTLREAVAAAAAFFAAESAARSFERPVLRADGRVTIERFGRRGGRRTVRTLGRVA